MRVKFRRSSTPGYVFEEIRPREIAINTADNKLYYHDGDGTVVVDGDALPEGLLRLLGEGVEVYSNTIVQGDPNA